MKRFTLLLLATLLLIPIYAESGRVGDQITLSFTPETDSNHPDFRSNTAVWSSNNTSKVSVAGNGNYATATILSYFDGTVTVYCKSLLCTKIR